MRPGRHAAGDGSFTRSAGAVGIRGAGLLLVAVILGVVLLNAADNGPGPAVVASSGRKSTTTTTGAPASTTSTVPVRPAEQVKVLAANGTVTRGLGTRATDKLKALGYNALAPTDASKKPATTSAVYWAVGYQPEARALAQQLALPDTAVQPLGNPPPVTNVGVANIIVVVGEDLAKTLSTTTSTTVKAGTATTVKSTTGTTTKARTSTTVKPKTTSTTGAAKTTTTAA